MTGRMPSDVILQMRAAILDAFDHDELWREISFRMDDLHDEVAHAGLHEEVSELIEWVGKRGRTLELLEHLNAAVPGNRGLQTAKTAVEAVEADSERKRSAQPPSIASFAGTQAPAQTSTQQETPPAAAGSAKKGFNVPPWVWMIVGAVILLVVAAILFSGDPVTYGDDDALDDLWDQCAIADFSSCDRLYERSPEGSTYEDFGSTCGDILLDGAFGQCAALASIPFTYGDNVALDSLWDGCVAGDFTACDQLYLNSPDDSQYEEVGSRCGFVDGPLTEGRCVEFAP